MSENTPENETAAPVQEAAVTEETGNMGSGCGQFDGSAPPLAEPAATPPGQPQSARAHGFLSLLGNDPWTFQTFDDDKERRKRNGDKDPLARVVHGSLDTHLAQLSQINEQGAGVYVTINETDGKGRSAENVVKVRAYFVDLDGAPIEPVTAWEMAPHIVVQSSPGKWHAYWLVSDAPCDSASFGRVQMGLIERFGGDRSVKDLPRVMRLPGFHHRKGAPQMVEVIHQRDDATPYTHAQVVAALAKPMPVVTSPGGVDMELLRFALPLVTADSYDSWFRYLCALKRDLTDDLGLKLFIELSANSPGYEGEVDCRRKWDRAPDSDDLHTTCHVIFHDAAPVAAKALTKESGPGDVRRVLRLLALGFADKTTAELVLATIRKQVPDTRLPGLRTDLAALRKETGPHPCADGDNTDGNTGDKVRTLLQEYVYCVGAKVFFNLGTQTQYDKEQFSNCHAVDFPLGGSARDTAALTFLNHPEARKVDNITYHPGGDPFITRDGRTYVNTWRRPSLVPRTGVTDEDIAPFLAHAEHLLPDKAQQAVIFDFMAYTLQKPERKINWAIFLGGDQGIGKDTLFVPLMKLVGEENHRIVSSDMLTSNFNEWAATKLVIIEEMAAFGNVAIVNKLKPYIAAPPYKLPINGKFLRPYEVPNIGNYVLFSNREDALPLDETDRRYFICWSKAEKRDDAYYRDLYAWFDANLETVYGWLMARDVSGFSAKGRAPMTEAKLEMALASRSPLEQHVSVCIEEGRFPFKADLIALSDVIDQFPRHINKVSHKALATVLKNLGAQHLGQALRSDGSRPNVWAVRNHDQYVAMTPSELGTTLGSGIPTDPVSRTDSDETVAQTDKVVNLYEDKGRRSAAQAT